LILAAQNEGKGARERGDVRAIKIPCLLVGVTGKYFNFTHPFMSELQHNFYGSKVYLLEN